MSEGSTLGFDVRRSDKYTSEVVHLRAGRFTLYSEYPLSTSYLVEHDLCVYQVGILVLEAYKASICWLLFEQLLYLKAAVT